MVDTAAAEFPAKSPYYYLSNGEQDEMRTAALEAVVVVGSGPIRIGQGIEFDYSCVHAAWALKDAGCSPVVINNNPETVSTDFDISDALVFEPPGADEVEATCRATNARGVMLAFGGQTAINLAAELSRRGVRSWAAIAARWIWRKIESSSTTRCARLGVARPQGKAARSFREARTIARELGFPVLVRPSFVLGGRAMEIVYNEAQLAAYADRRRRFFPMPRYWSTSICAVRSSKWTRSSTARTSSFRGFSNTSSARACIPATRSASIPYRSIDEAMERRIADITHSVARELQIRGLINIQFVLHGGRLHIIEANPRASRTVPIIQKATGINIVAAATRVALGRSCATWRTASALRPHVPYVVVKVPVFSFSKMRGVETILGPEMKSTGEVLGIDETFGGALRKGFHRCGRARARDAGTHPRLDRRRKQGGVRLTFCARMQP